jgi:TonB family protein
MDAVTQILVDRSHEADSLSRTVLLSLAAHAALLALVVFLPAGWGSAVKEDKAVMVVSLAGAPGPRQGLNPMTTRPVQQATPDLPKPKNEPPPALAKPEMVEPIKSARPQPTATAKPEPKKPEPQLHGRTPTTGPQPKSGTARVETGAQSSNTFGLATGGGGAGAAYTDVANFCCPEYLETMVQLVQRNWQQNQGVDGTVVVKFTIRRDGLMQDVEIEQQSTPFLNLAAQRAIVSTRQLPALPAAYTNDHLTVHLVFQFKR